MGNRKLSFWVMTLVGVPAFVWLLAELVRAFAEVVGRSGISSVPFDGVIQHKVGELMVGAPLFLALVLSNVWPAGRAADLARRTRAVMAVGGLLNGLAWYSLRERETWDSFFRVWCLILLFAGLLGSRIAVWMVNARRGREDS
jgi:hypothetical protein